MTRRDYTTKEAWMNLGEEAIGAAKDKFNVVVDDFARDPMGATAKYYKSGTTAKNAGRGAWAKGKYYLKKGWRKLRDFADWLTYVPEDAPMMDPWTGAVPWEPEKWELEQIKKEEEQAQQMPGPATEEEANQRQAESEQRNQRKRELEEELEKQKEERRAENERKAQEKAERAEANKEDKKQMKKELHKIAKDELHNQTDSYIMDIMGLDPEADPETYLTYKAMGGTNAGKLLQALRDKHDGKEAKNLNASTIAGGIGEIIGGLTKDAPGSTWTPKFASTISTAVTGINPWLGAAIQAGGLLWSSKPARDAVKWAAGKVGDGIGWVWDKITGKKRDVSPQLALQHNSGRIKMIDPSRVEVLKEVYKGPASNIAEEAHNRPNIGVRYETKDAYLRRLTGHEHPIPANHNRLTYSGPRNDRPAYPRTDNQVLIAPPRPGRIEEIGRADPPDVIERRRRRKRVEPITYDPPAKKPKRKLKRRTGKYVTLPSGERMWVKRPPKRTTFVPRPA